MTTTEKTTKPRRYTETILPLRERLGLQCYNIATLPSFRNETSLAFFPISLLLSLLLLVVVVTVMVIALDDVTVSRVLSQKKAILSQSLLFLS